MSSIFSLDWLLFRTKKMVSKGSIHHLPGVLAGPENHDAAIGGSINFQSFKHLLAVLQDTGAFIEGHGGIVGQFARVYISARSARQCQMALKRYGKRDGIKNNVVCSSGSLWRVTVIIL